MKEQSIYLILSNNSDCDDLSVYRYEGTRYDAYKHMQAMVIATAGKTDENEYLEVDMNSSEMTASIQWADHHEEFRIVPLNQVTDIMDADGVAEANLDAIPDDISWDNKAAHYALHDVGRE